MAARTTWISCCRVRVGPRRAYIWHDDNRQHQALLATGSVRIQNVLTETGHYVFVSDASTQNRIDNIVESAGGSLEQRLRSAIEAANNENIGQVFQLSINSLAGDFIQIVLSVYETGSSDRIFMRDAAVDSSEALQVLEAFDQLGRDYTAWSQSRAGSR